MGRWGSKSAIRLGIVLGIASGACGSDGTTSGSSSGGSSSGAASSSGDQCNDCGACGIAGPVGTTAMRAQTFGVDATKRAAVTLDLAREGECEGENKHPSTLHVAAGSADFEIGAGFEMLDRTKAKADTTMAGKTVYVWNDRDLSVDVDNAGANGLTLTFSSAGAKVLTVKCLPTGETGACTKE